MKPYAELAKKYEELKEKMNSAASSAKLQGILSNVQGSLCVGNQISIMVMVISFREIYQSLVVQCNFNPPLPFIQSVLTSRATGQLSAWQKSRPDSSFLFRSFCADGSAHSERPSEECDDRENPSLQQECSTAVVVGIVMRHCSVAVLATHCSMSTRRDGSVVALSTPSGLLARYR